MMRPGFIFFVLLCTHLSVGAQTAPKKAEDLDVFFRDKTKIENPLDLRDPFKSPPARAGKRQVETGRAYFKPAPNEFTNIAQSNPQQLNIYDIKVVGVMIGKERRALIQQGAGNAQGGGSQRGVMILKEGAKIGADGAELKAILPGGIVVVEKIVNVYGQEEYLETVIPISR
jgi:type IV pilus assembly protein PilP